jgi:hypothetical protein
MFTLSLLAMVASVIAQAQHPSLEFDPPQLKINDLNQYGTVKVRLRQQPTDKVLVHYAANSLQFDSCGIEFNSNDWNVYKELKVYPVPVFQASQSTYNVPIQFGGFGLPNVPQNTTFEYGIERQVGVSGTCSAVGEPHFRVSPLCCRNYLH